MKKFIPVLKRTQMFSGVSVEEIESMLSCLGARLCEFDKGECVIRQGERLSDILILADGNLYIQKDDYWGNRSILGQISAGEMFGEAYVAPESGAVLSGRGDHWGDTHCRRIPVHPSGAAVLRFPPEAPPCPGGFCSPEQRARAGECGDHHCTGPPCLEREGIAA